MTWPVATALGAGDCEAIHSGFLAQPGNALSSLAYVAAGVGLVLLRRRLPESGRLGAAGALLVAVGAGSFLYHGPAPAGAQFVHDVTIGALFGFLAWWSAPDVLSRRGWATAAGGTIATLAIVPSASGFVLGVVGAGAALALVVRLRSAPATRRRLVAVAVVAIAAGAAAILGATDGPWCHPDSALQAHAAWHLLGGVALALAAISLATTPVTGSAAERHAPDRVTR